MNVSTLKYGYRAGCSAQGGSEECPVGVQTEESCGAVLWFFFAVRANRMHAITLLQTEGSLAQIDVLLHSLHAGWGRRRVPYPFLFFFAKEKKRLLKPGSLHVS